MSFSLNLHNMTAAMDIESLLWEMRDLLLGYSELVRQQSVVVPAAYSTRASTAVLAVDAALDEYDGAREIDAAYNTSFNESYLAAWAEAAGEDEDESSAEQGGSYFLFDDDDEESVLPSDSISEYDVPDYESSDDSAELYTTAPQSLFEVDDQEHDDSATLIHSADGTHSVVLRAAVVAERKSFFTLAPRVYASDEDSDSTLEADEDSDVVRAMARHAFLMQGALAMPDALLAAARKAMQLDQHAIPAPLAAAILRQH